jgi:hypothetical protein
MILSRIGIILLLLWIYRQHNKHTTMNNHSMGFLLTFISQSSDYHTKEAEKKVYNNSLLRMRCLWPKKYMRRKFFFIALEDGAETKRLFGLYTILNAIKMLSNNFLGRFYVFFMAFLPPMPYTSCKL